MPLVMIQFSQKIDPFGHQFLFFLFLYIFKKETNCVTYNQCLVRCVYSNFLKKMIDSIFLIVEQPACPLCALCGRHPFGSQP